MQENCTVDKCYATADIQGDYNVGFVGYAALGCEIKNSYFTGNASGYYDGVSGILGMSSGSNTIDNCYASGVITGNAEVGGIVGYARMRSNRDEDELIIRNSASYCTVQGSENRRTGSFIGSYIYKQTVYPEYDGTTPPGEYLLTLTVDNCKSVTSDDYGLIGGAFYELLHSTADDEHFHKNDEYDLSAILENITVCSVNDNKTNIQAGINSDSSNRISFNTGFRYNLSNIVSSDNITENSLRTIDYFMNTMSKYATKLGAASNKLESALESISVATDNLVSSRSTLRDADLGEVSSDFIRQQILQQACATLMSTANQSPSIALQLL